MPMSATDERGGVMQLRSKEGYEKKKAYNARYKRENQSRIPLDVSKEYHIYLKGVAASAGMPLNSFIKQAVEEKCNNVKDEIPPEVISNLIKWLKDHGHDDNDVADCLHTLSVVTES